ncbi:hypothetical protein Tco_0777868 [Tanacetum coccineum]
MTHDPPEGVVRFTNKNDEVTYTMPYKIEQYNSLSNLEKEHTKSVYLRNEEDKRRGVEYMMSKILGFYKECLELGPEYLTGMDDEGEVTFLALGWILEEIHVTWAHLEKKQTRLRLYTKSLKKLCIQSVETALRVSSDDVRTFEVTTLEICPRDRSEKIYKYAKHVAATASGLLATASGLKIAIQWMATVSRFFAKVLGFHEGVRISCDTVGIVT